MYISSEQDMLHNVNMTFFKKILLQRPDHQTLYMLGVT